MASEDRCLGIPQLITSSSLLRSHRTLWIHDPEDGFPRFAEENHRYTKENFDTLFGIHPNVDLVTLELIESEGSLISLSEQVLAEAEGNILLDISVMPKRIFALIVKRFLRDSRCRRLLVTYTAPAGKGYTTDPLSHDPLPPDGLPGFNHDGFGSADSLLVSIGFEPHQLESFVRSYLQASTSRDIRAVIPFPPNGDRFRRNWRALRALTEGQPANIRRENISVIAAWDMQAMYDRISLWSKETESMIFAAFGPKPHTLAMVCFLSDFSEGGSIVYSQPKVYSPRYSSGIGETYCYLLKGGDS